MLLLKMVLIWIKVSYITFLLLDKNSADFVLARGNITYVERIDNFLTLRGLSDFLPSCSIECLNSSYHT